MFQKDNVNYQFWVLFKQRNAIEVALNGGMNHLKATTGGPRGDV